jgi:hypothetical protein
MADPESSEETPNDKPTVTPDYSANALRREPATIEGTAEDLTTPEPEAAHKPVEEPEALNLGHLPPEPGAPDHPFSPLPELEPETPPDEAYVAPPAESGRRGGLFAPTLLALIIGGAAGFGGAYGLRLIDKSDAKFDILSERVGALEQQQKATAALTTAQADLANRITAIETRAHDDSAGFLTLRSDIERLTTQKPQAATANAPADLGPLRQQLSALQDKLSSLTAQVSDLSGKFSSQQNQVAAVQHLATQVATAHAGDEAAAIIAGSLLRKAEAGTPFADDLTALESHGVDKAQLASLQAAGATGVATTGELSKQFAAQTDAILATAPAPKAHGFLDRLMKDAEGLVRVRKIGDTTGDDLAAHVARIQSALDAGSVETAYQQWTSLPDAAKQKSQAFGHAAKTRLDTIEAARAIESGALASLGKAKS